MATDYLKLAQEAYQASTTFAEANYRKDWDYSLRAFRNEHAADSKYSSPEYERRSRIFHPKTRSIIRKNEAAGMQAAFSNREMVSAEPTDPDSQWNVAAAAALKEVIQYRLSRTIPTYEIYVGGLQDAQTTGAVVSYQYWEYLKRKDGTKVKDRPCIELRPIENIRFDPGASWIDVVNTSPYWCDIVPMYVCDVRAMMDNKDDKTGAPKWKKYKDEEIALARPDDMDSTRRSRLGQSQDPQEERPAIKSFDIVWVLRWFMRDSQGEDQTFYTLGTEKLLTDAKPIEDVYFHGKRPYVMGCAIIETHKAHKTSMPVLIRPLQQAVNQIGNSRFDNVQLVLNKRYYVARGRQTDVQSLVRNTAGGVTLTSNPKEDIIEANWPDVTSSSYVENDRLSAEMDDLAGNFSPSTKVANNAVNDTLGGSKMAAAGAGLMSEYLIRTINETWWEKVLRQLGLLEQYYETDETVLAVCASKAKLFPRFGVSRITDQLMMEEVFITVDMALGDPMQRFQKFIMAIQSCIQIISTAPPGVNVQECCKEIMSNAGYRDGARFISEQQDPRLLKAMQALQQMGEALKGKQMELQAQAQLEGAKIQSSDRQKAAQLQVDLERIRGTNAVQQAELLIEQQRLELEKLKVQIEAQGADQDLKMRAVELQKDIETAEIKLQGEREKQAASAAQSQMDIEKSALELARSRTEMANESRIGEVAEQVSGSMQDVRAEIEAIKGALNGVSGEFAEQKKGLNALAGFVLQERPEKPRAKAKGLRLVKPDGKKTKAVVIEFDDDTQQELSVS